jgi:hypothetical protein
MSLNGEISSMISRFLPPFEMTFQAFIYIFASSSVMASSNIETQNLTCGAALATTGASKNGAV